MSQPAQVARTEHHRLRGLNTNFFLMDLEAGRSEIKSQHGWVLLRSAVSLLRAQAGEAERGHKLSCVSFWLDTNPIMRPQSQQSLDLEVLAALRPLEIRLNPVVCGFPGLIPCLCPELWVHRPSLELPQSRECGNSAPCPPNSRHPPGLIPTKV